jgi:NAD-reducing hydrogenase large subunit
MRLKKLRQLQVPTHWDRLVVAIRAYDPCLSCATHALGDMPLIVTLEDADGSVIATRVKQ